MKSEKKFDCKKFESLKGLELGEYVCTDENLEGLNEEFLNYFKINCQSFDVVHLEYAVFLLGKIKTKEAYREIAKYIDHSNLSIRFVAFKIMSNNEDYSNIDELILKDTFIMGKIKKTIEDNNEDNRYLGMYALKRIVERHQELLERESGSS